MNTKKGTSGFVGIALLSVAAVSLIAGVAAWELRRITNDENRIKNTVSSNSEVGQKLVENLPTAKPSVLAAQANNLKRFFEINVPAVFRNDLTTKNVIVGGTMALEGNVTGNNVNINLGKGEITASNVVYSLQGKSGKLELIAGDGIVIDGLKISAKDFNDKQKYFKNFKTDSGEVVANNANDTLTVVGGDGMEVTANAGSKTITISATEIPLGSNTSGDYVKNLTAGTGVQVVNNSGEGSTPSVSLSASGVTPGSYTSTNITVDSYGRITSASNGSGGTGYISSLTGDVTATGPDAAVATIANNAVTLAKMAQLASNSIIGNNTGASATPIALTPSEVKTMLALGNVENTALSTWAGSSNITTVGTITSGTWRGSTVTVGYGGTGAGQMTQGSIIFAGASGVYSQDNANFYWDDLNNHLGIGTVNPATTLEIVGNLGIKNGTYKTTFSNSGTQTVDVAYVLPTAAGTAGQVLKTDASGNLYWATVEGGSGGIGTVTSVASGNGLTGGPITTSGTLSVNVLNSQTASTATTSSYSGLEFVGANNQLSLLHGCSANNVLSWDDTAKKWQCSSISGIGAVSGSGAANRVAYWSGASALTSNAGYTFDGATLALAAAAAPTADMQTISNSGFATTTNGADGLSLDFTSAATTGNNSGINVNYTPSGQSGNTGRGINISTSGIAAGSLYGINIAGITGGAGTETALVIGSGWDKAIDASGLISTTSGVITPKIYPATDSTTAIQINKADGTTNVLNVDTTNSRVGIGTTSPGFPLEVNSSTTGNLATFYAPSADTLESAIRIRSSRGTIASPVRNYQNNVLGSIYFGGYMGYGFNDAAAIQSIADVNDWASDINPGNLIFKTRAVTNGASLLERMRITSAGNVGIGTTSPANRLTVTAPTTADALADVMIGTSATTQKGLVIQGKASQTANLFETQLSTGAIKASINSAGDFTNSQGNSLSEAFGAGALANTESVAIGYNASGPYYSVAIGAYSASSLSGPSISIGRGAKAGADGAAFGFNADSSSFQNSIVFGRNITATASNQFIAGGAESPINNVYFGKGVVNATPTVWTLNGTGGSGTNIAGAALQLAGGKATGNAVGGPIYFQTSDATTSGTTLQSLTTKMTLTAAGNVGIGTTSPSYPLDVANSSNGLFLRAGGAYAGSIYSGTANSQIGFGYNGTTSYASRIATTHNSGAATGNGMYFYLNDNSTSGGRLVGEFDAGTGLYTQVLDSNTNGITSILALSHNLENGGIAANGIGSALKFQSQDFGVLNADVGQIAGVLTDVTNATKTGALTFSVVNNGSALTEAMRISGSGNVGIGTTSPGAGLDIRSSNSGIYFSAGNPANYNITYEYGVGLHVNFGSSHRITFAENSTTFGLGAGLGAMRLMGTSGAYGYISAGSTNEILINPTGGNVGIGTTSPNAKLQVAGGAYFGNGDSAGWDYGNGQLTLNSTNSDSRIDFGQSPTNYSVFAWRYNSNAANATFDIGTAGNSNDIRIDGKNILLQSISSGNVGIGTTSPGAPLDVRGEVRFDGYSTGLSSISNTYFQVRSYYSRFTSNGGSLTGLQINNTSSNKTWTLLTAGVSGNDGTPSGAFGIHDGSNSIVSIESGGVQNSLYIKSSGNVGIGTTSPAVKLDVVGDASITGTGNTWPMYMNTNSATGTFALITNTLNSPGPVGGLLFSSQSSTLYRKAGILFKRTENNANRGYLAFAVDGNNSNSNVDANFDANTRMVIDYTGNVGIGTTSPGFPLEVNSSTTGNLATFYAPSADTLESAIRIRSSRGTIASPVRNYQNNVLGSIYFGGYMGYGFNDAAAIQSIADVNDWASDINPGNLIFKTRAVTNGASLLERMRITSAGNVGIGTTSPANKLTVTAPTTADALADVMIGTSATTQKGLVIQGKASQTASYFEVQDSTGAMLASIYPAYGQSNISLGTSNNVILNYASIRGNVLSVATTGGSYYAPISVDQINLYGPSNTTRDTALSRISAGVVAVGNSVAGNYSGTLQATNLIASKLYPAADSTTAIQINKADGTTNVLNVDTTNSRVGIGVTNPSTKLDVAGNLRLYPASGVSYIEMGIGSTLYAQFGVAAASTQFFTDASAGDFGLRAETGKLLLGVGANHSSIAISGSNVGIGTTSPGELLSLGTAGTTAGVLSLAGGTSGKAIIQTSAAAGTPTLTLPTSTGTLALTSDIPTALWYQPTTPGNNLLSASPAAGNLTMTGTDNAFIGYQAGLANTSGSNNVFAGALAGRANTSGNYNNFFGYGAGTANTTGERNFFAGYYAGSSNTTGSYNIFVGHTAGRYNDIGTGNIGFGNEAGYNLYGSHNFLAGFQAGYGVYGNMYSNNVFIGFATGKNVTTGSENVFAGYKAGYSNTTGANNIFLGGSATTDQQVGYSNTTGSNNIFMGYGAGFSNTTASNNIGLGYNALYTNSTGVRNVAIGENALKLNTGSDNTAIGRESLLNNSSGAGNTAVGRDSLTSNTIASGNTAVGVTVLRANTTGNYNSAFGYEAGRYTTTGSNNLVIGYQAGYGSSGSSYSNNSFVGYQSGYANATAADNTALGYNSLKANTYGAKNVAIGSGALYTQSYANGNSAWDTGNVAIGYQSLYTNNPTSNLNGMNNTTVGYQSGYLNTTGSSNFFGGFQAGYANGTGSNNTAVGYVALSLNRTSSDNTAIGYTALQANTYGAKNVAIGSGALYTQSYANGNVAWDTANVAIGYQALYYNQPSSNANGLNNTAIGGYAGFGSVASGTAKNNLFLGYKSGYSITTGSDNAFLGYNAGYKETSSIGAVLIGSGAGYNNVNRSSAVYIGYNAGYNLNDANNTLVGYQASYYSTSGTDNVSLGYRAGYGSDGQTGGSGNTFIGSQSGASITSAGSNTFLGYQSGTQTTSGQMNVILGHNAGYSNTTGSTNTFVGQRSGYNSTGSGNIFLGQQAGWKQTTNSNLLIIDNQDRTSAALEATNALIYGTFDAVPANQRLTLNASVRIGALVAGGGGAVAVYRDANGDLADSTSSIQYKDNVTDMEPVMAKIMALKAVRFDWKDDTSTPGMADFGMISEEVNKVLPDLVTYQADGVTPHGLKYEKMGLFALKGLQEQQGQIDALSARLAELEAQGALTKGTVAAAQTKELIAALEDDFVKIKEIVTEKITAKTAHVEGLEMVDHATKDVYCTWIENGDWKKEKGNCDDVLKDKPVVEQPAPEEKPTPKVDEPVAPPADEKPADQTPVMPPAAENPPADTPVTPADEPAAPPAADQPAGDVPVAPMS